MIVKTWLGEEKTILDTCAYLKTTETTGTQTITTEAIKAAFRDDAINGVATLFSALGVSQAVCDPAQLVTKALSTARREREADGDMVKCKEEVRRRLPALDAKGSAAVTSTTIDQRQQSLANAVRAYGLSPEDLVFDPIRIAHVVDFSPAAVSGLVWLADELDDATDKLASSVGIGQGLLRAILQELAAEALAYALDIVVEKLEVARYVQSASVSRSACKIYERGTVRASVTKRLLKRIILRFTGTWQTQANDYPPAAACAMFKKADEDALRRDVCADFARTAGAPASTARQSAAGELTPALPPPVLAVQPRAPVPADAQVLLDAAHTCSSAREKCTLDVVANLSSIMKVNGADAGAGMNQLREQLKRIEELFGGTAETISALENDARNLHGSFDDIRQTLAESGQRDRAFQMQLLEMLSRGNDKCRLYLRALEKNRVTLVKKYLRFESLVGAPPTGSSDRPDPTCARTEDQNAHYLASLLLPGSTQTVPGSDSAILLSHSALCNLGQPLEFSIVKADAFPACDHRASAPALAIVDVLADVIKAAKLQPTSIVVIGHADERPLHKDCTAYSDNHQLSESRAEMISSVLAKKITNVHIEHHGHGTSELLRKCAIDDETCHSRNRRMSIQLIGGPILAVNPDCE